MTNASAYAVVGIVPQAPAPNDDPQALFDLIREDGVIVGHFYNYNDAVFICDTLNNPQGV